MKNAIIIILIIFSLFSCKNIGTPIPDGNTFFFENPQPINDSELKSFPNKFEGLYVNSDSLFLRINGNLIVTEFEYKFRFLKTKLDSLKNEFVLKNGKYIQKNTNEEYDFKTIGDSIQFSTKNSDTIFIFSDTNKAKRMFGQLVLNEKDSIYWKVKTISLKNNIVTLKQPYSDSDLKSMDSITKIHSKQLDSTHYVIKPSRREFKKFLQLKNFGYNLDFKRISN
jgi:hypothetical protein